MSACFNGHTSYHPGCAGCHFAFHVKAPGKVVGGKLVPPVVDGPLTCPLCHEALHATPVNGCPQCAERFSVTLASAEAAAQPIRQEIAMLKFRSWALRWQTTLAGWLSILLGGYHGDWYGPQNRSQGIMRTIFFMAALPLAQWVIRRRIRERESQLPTLSPEGAIVYGPQAKLPSEF